jgi:hypothetical protein
MRTGLKVGKARQRQADTSVFRTAIRARTSQQSGRQTTTCPELSAKYGLFPCVLIPSVSILGGYEEN